MSSPGLVIDTDSLLAYTRGIPDVGELIAARSDADEVVLVPVLCLAQAYRSVTSDDHVLLDVIQGVPNVRVTPVEPDMAVFLGGFSRSLERMDLAQVVITAAQHGARVLTSERKLISRFLPSEWPIVDL